MFQQQFYGQSQQPPRRNQERQEMFDRDEIARRERAERMAENLQQANPHQRPVYMMNGKFSQQPDFGQLYHERTPSVLSFDEQQSVKSKKAGSKKANGSQVKAQTARTARNRVHEELLDPVVIDEIRGIKNDLAYLEKDLSYVFPDFAHVQPFYKQQASFKHLDSTARPAEKSSSIDRPVKEVAVQAKQQSREAPKKTNKYIQNYLDKYESGDQDLRTIDNSLQQKAANERMKATLPKTKPAAPREPQKHQPASNLYPLVSEPLTFDSHIPSHNASGLSLASNSSKRKENFENFRRNYFGDGGHAAPADPIEDRMSKFTRNNAQPAYKPPQFK